MNSLLRKLRNFTSSIIKTYLIISSNPWGNLHISKHNYAIELERLGNRVFFMNPPNQKQYLKGYEITKIEGFSNLFFIDFSLINNRYIDFARFRLKITQILDWILLRTVNRICKAENLYFEAIINFDPNLHGFFHKYPSKRKIFFIADQIQNTSQNRCGKKADLVVSVADEILIKFKKINNNCLLINHGLNKQYEDFALNNLQKIVNINSKELVNQKIRVGYIGNLLIPFLYEEGLKKIVINNPTINFHFWGPYSSKNNNLLSNYDQKVYDTVQFLRENCSNAHFYGVQTSNEIIENLDKIDLFIYINSSTKDINGGANSHKILEYLSTGKAIVSTYLSFYKNHTLFPFTKKGEEENYEQLFNDSINQLDILNSKDLQKKRIEFVLQNTYQKNIEKILNYSNN